SAGYYQLGPVSPGLLEFAVPTPRAQKLRPNLLNRRREDRLQELVSRLADRFLRRPAVHLLSAPIPISNDVAHVSDENRVVCEIQQAGLLGSFRHFDFEVFPSLTKLSLDAASNGAEPGEQRCERGESNKVRDIRRCDLERVNRLCEEVVEAYA